MSSINFEKQKQPELAKHDASILDLAFAMDATGSMGSYIENARKSIRQIVEEIVASEKSNVHLALVEYRDHPPQEETFVTRTHDFTSSVKEMKGWLEACQAQGGGDLPEAVADAMHDALKLSWRENSTKICILISDAPPHGLSSNSDSFPQGCPAGIDPIDVAKKMAQKGIILYCVGVEPPILPYKDFFSAIAFMTGGQYVPLTNADMLAKVIIGSAQEEISLNKLTETVEQEIMEHQRLGITDEFELAKAVETSLKSKGVKSKQLKKDGAKFDAPSSHALNYSKMTSLAEINKDFISREPPEAFLRIEHDSFAPRMMMSKSKKQSMPMSLMAHPPPGAAFEYAVELSEAVEASASKNEYSVETNDVDIDQAYRMVSKALNRNKK